MKWRFLKLIVIFMMIDACKPRESNSDLISHQLDDSDFLFWSQKTSRMIRSGTSLSPEEMAAIRGKSLSQIIDHFMGDELFVNSLVQFNLYYLGFLKEERRLKLSGKINVNEMRDIADEFPQTFNAALEAYNSRNFFKLYNYKQDAYFSGSRIRVLFADDFPDVDKDEIKKINDAGSEAGIAFLKTRIDTAIGDLSKLFQSTDPKQWRIGCDAAFSRLDLDDFKPPKYDFDDLFRELINSGDRSAPLFLSRIDIVKDCTAANINIEKLRNDFSIFVEDVSRNLTFVQDELLPIKQESIKRYSQFLNISRKMTGYEKESWSSQMWTALPNSSTNMNRKRGAYALKTFFCDDLTPVDLSALVENMPKHGSDAHASDPKCVTCHYKLDPMAGFFRNHGFFGFDFLAPERYAIKLGEDKVFMFDDRRALNTQEFTSYLGQWRQNGLIRSNSSREKNTYESNENVPPLQKLLAMAKTLPEAKVCLTRRLAEFFISPTIAYDDGWIQDLSNNFNVEDEQSGVALKTVIKRLLLSKSFMERDPVEGQCYDFKAESKDAQAAIPCEIKSIIQKNCISCHGAGNSSDGVNLERWKQLSDGKSGFEINKNGQTLSSLEAKKLILKSLLSKDGDKRMPLNKFILDSEKVRLVKFFE